MTTLQHDSNRAAADPPPAGERPAAPSTLFTPRHLLLYGLAVVLAVGVFLGAVYLFRQQIDQYQYNRPDYAAERALEALAQGNADQARFEVEQLLAETPVRIALGRWVNDSWEGPILRNRVQTLNQLSARLMAASLPDEAEAIAWKGQLEYHLASRPLELFDPWELMYYLKLVRSGYGAAWEVSRILAAHGADRVRDPRAIEPVPYELDPALYQEQAQSFPPALIRALARSAAATTATEHREVAEALRQVRQNVPHPIVRRRLDAQIQRSLLAAGLRPEARAHLAKIWGRPDLTLMDLFWRDAPGRQTAMNPLERDPTLLEMLWRDRPTTATLTVSGFLGTFVGDSRVQLVDLRQLKRQQTGYFNPANKIYVSGDELIMSQATAATMPVTTRQPVHQIALALRATPALGVYPILLLRVDGGTWQPIYCDAAEPAIVTLDYPLTQPGNHTFEFLYLNDAGFSFPSRQVSEDRNLHLYRMALILVPPSE